MPPEASPFALSWREPEKDLATKGRRSLMPEEQGGGTGFIAPPPEKTTAAFCREGKDFKLSKEGLFGGAAEGVRLLFVPGGGRELANRRETRRKSFSICEMKRRILPSLSFKEDRGQNGGGDI